MGSSARCAVSGHIPYLTCTTPCTGSISGSTGVLGLYLAHVIVRQVDFSIRHHGAATVDQWLTYARGLVEIMEATSS